MKKIFFSYCSNDRWEGGHPRPLTRRERAEERSIARPLVLEVEKIYGINVTSDVNLGEMDYSEETMKKDISSADGVLRYESYEFMRRHTIATGVDNGLTGGAGVSRLGCYLESAYAARKGIPIASLSEEEVDACRGASCWPELVFEVLPPDSKGDVANVVDVDVPTAFILKPKF